MLPSSNRYHLFKCLHSFQVNELIIIYLTFSKYLYIIFPPSLLFQPEMLFHSLTDIYMT